jgi:uncharacterized protein YbaA (DUF1428 family)
MTQIYCVKCKKQTNTKSEKVVAIPKGRKRLIGICTVCNSNKGVFASNQGKIANKTEEEREETRFSRIERQQKKEALAIGWKVLADPEVEKCVKNCFAKARKQNKSTN